MTVGDIAFSAGTNRERRPGAAGRAEHHSVSHYRCRDDLIQISVAPPQLTSVGGIVGLNSLLAVDDQFIVITGANCNGRTPSHIGVTSGSPELPPGACVESRNERIRIRILI